MAKFRLGADPEVLLKNARGKHMSAIGYIGADKHNPLQIKGMKKGFTLQEDNVSLEYGIPPASSGKELWENIHAVMEKSKEWIPSLRFSNLSCVIMPKDQMMHPAAHVFGCEPDLNAWTKEVNPSPQPPHPFMRSAGGHVHIETKEDPFKVIRTVDGFLGIASVLMDVGTERRKFYGKAGACRVKPYGVEYRTLSNFWIFKPELCQWVWNGVDKALENLGKFDEYGEIVQECINTSNRELAATLAKDFKLEVVV